MNGESHPRSGVPHGWLVALLATAPRASAAGSPSIDVLGSYFPAWLICMVAGVVLTVLARLFLRAVKLDPYLWAKPIVYPCLAALFAMAVWLVLYRH
jgi:hypothetical protein